MATTAPAAGRIAPVALLAGLLLAGCRPVDLSAPPNAKVTVAAQPTSIAVVGGTAAITATVLTAAGIPVPDGTVVWFFTTLGTIDPRAETELGQARVTLTSGGVPGLAVVTALSGNSTAATTEVTVGIAAATVTLAASPDAIPTEGGTLQITATVRSESGEPVAGQVVLLSATSPAVLRSGGQPLTTDAQGQVHDELTTPAAATTVTATLVGSSVTATLALAVEVLPVASVVATATPGSLSSAGGSSTIDAYVLDAQGQPVPGITVTFQTNLGSVSPLTDRSNAQGRASTVLTTTQTTAVTATAAGKSDSVVVVVGASGPTRILVITPNRAQVSDPTPTGGAPCVSGGPNVQLPVTLVGTVTDADGDPINGVTVDLAIEDLSTDDNDAQGGFCDSTGALVSTATAVTGSSGAGQFTLSYSFDDPELAACDALTPPDRCSATIVATAGSTVATTTIHIQ